MMMGIKRMILSFYRWGHSLFREIGLKSRLLKKFNGILIRWLKKDKVIIGKNLIYLDKDDSLRLSTRGYYEPIITDLIKREVKEGDVVVDVGAHIGYYTLIFAELVGEKGKVYAFEPDPDNFDILRKNVEVNGYKNVILEQKAVSNQRGIVRLFLGKERSAHHTLSKNDYSSDESVPVEAIRLDDYFKEESIDFIKLDVEGGEYNALNGMLSLLKRSSRLKMVVEMVPVFLEEMSISSEHFLSFLHKHGFDVTYINEGEFKINLNAYCTKK